MTMEARISVIVPVYKVEAYLNECIRSILEQTYTNLEVILVDDGSPDHCPQMCEEWADRDSRVNVIHKQNGGLSSARNAGLDICTGDYIAFVDSDDWIMPDMYQSMYDAIKAEAADICACNIISCYPDRKVTWGGKSYLAGDSETMLGLLYDDAAFPVCAWNKLYKRELWEHFRFPEGKLCEDAFTTYLLLHKADRIVQITDALYCYRIRPESIMTSAFSSKSMDEEEAWRENDKFIQTHYPRLRRRAHTFYVQSVNVLIHRIKKEQKEQYRKEYVLLKRIMLKNIFFIVFQSTASMKYRFRYLMDCTQL